MADEPAGRTSLGVLHEILNNLGDSNQYHYLVDALEALKDLLGEGGIGEAVSEWLAAHPEATTTVQNGSITLLKLANDVKSAINGKAESSDLQTLADNLEALAQTVAEKADASDLDDKADIDGYYSQLTAGLAENLIGRGDAVPAEYLYRTAGGTADIEDGIATIDCIKGNTLVWNQLIGSFLSDVTADGITRTRVENTGACIIDGTNTKDSTIYFAIAYNIPNIKAGHVYYLSTNQSEVAFYVNVDGMYSLIKGPHIATANADCNISESQMILAIPAGATFSNLLVIPQLFDLTLMFGAGNEPATVEEFEAMFPKAYYPYSEPTLLSVNMEGVETVGFNQWDEEWEAGGINGATGGNSTSSTGIRSKNYIPVIPEQTYGISIQGYNSNWIVVEYDSDKKYLRYLKWGGSQVACTTFTISSDARYIRFATSYVGNAGGYGTTYNNDICINLSWSGYRNGEYEKHWSEERHIDTSRFFPTGMKKAGSKEDALYADHYDTVIGAVDLGTLTWFYNSSTSLFYTNLNDAVRDKNTGVRCSCAIYTAVEGYGISGAINDPSVDKACSVGSSYQSSSQNLLIRDTSYTDPTAFKAAMSGVILYYELATPITTEIDPPLNLSYKVSDFGTERIMVDETADAPQTAPVPMEVEYGINAIDTIRRLPKEYQSHKSMGQLTAALESSLGVDITETWDETNGRYEYEVSQFELADGSIPDTKLVQTGGVLSVVYQQISVDENDGYISSAGTIDPAGDTTQEKYTNVIDVRLFAQLNYSYRMTESHSYWLAYAAYDRAGNFMSRVVLGTAWGTELSGILTVPSGVAYIRFTYRTYGEQVFSVRGSGVNRDLVTAAYGYPESLANQNLFSINASSGGYQSNANISKATPYGERLSDYIPVAAGDVYTISATATADSVSSSYAHWCACAMFDSDKNYINVIVVSDVVVGTTTLTRKVTIPSSCSYIRVSARLYNDGYVSVIKGDVGPDMAIGLGRYDRAIIETDKPFGRLMMGQYGAYINLDTVSEMLVIPRDCILLVNKIAPNIIDTCAITTNQSTAVEIPYGDGITISSAVKFVYSPSKKEWYALDWYTPLNRYDDIIIAAGRVRGTDKPSLSCSCPWSVNGIPYNLDLSGQMSYLVDAINHRGYNTVAPENTLPAFKLSKVNGFDCVECDVSMTSDRVPVLLHDNTINRTARNADGTEISGTVNIGDITYEQALEYDFGIWKSTTYAGTKIPTFEQFIKLCRNLGLHAYIELKSGGGYTEQEVQSLVDMVKLDGMSGKVSWISFDSGLLTYVKNYDPSARLGFVVGGVTSNVIATAQALKTSTNEVFIDSSTYTDAEVTLCVDADIPLEVWTVNSAATIEAMPSYVTGVTSDSQIAGKVLYQANV